MCVVNAHPQILSIDMQVAETKAVLLFFPRELEEILHVVVGFFHQGWAFAPMVPSSGASNRAPLTISPLQNKIRKVFCMWVHWESTVICVGHCVTLPHFQCS